MEIQVLRLIVTEQDLHQLAGRELRNQSSVKDVKIQVTPEGVLVSGVYQLLVNISFDMVWHLSVRGGKLAAHLANLRFSGFGAAMFRGTLLDLLSEAVQQEDWIQFDSDTLTIDADQLLAKRGLTARTNLSAVRCEQGHLVLEAAAPTLSS